MVFLGRRDETKDINRDSPPSKPRGRNSNNVHKSVVPLIGSEAQTPRPAPFSQTPETTTSLTEGDPNRHSTGEVQAQIENPSSQSVSDQNFYIQESVEMDPIESVSRETTIISWSSSNRSESLELHTPVPVAPGTGIPESVRNALVGTGVFDHTGILTPNARNMTPYRRNRETKASSPRNGKPEYEDKGVMVSPWPQTPSMHQPSPTPFRHQEGDTQRVLSPLPVWESCREETRSSMVPPRMLRTENANLGLRNPFSSLHQERPGTTSPWDAALGNINLTRVLQPRYRDLSPQAPENRNENDQETGHCQSRLHRSASQPRFWNDRPSSQPLPYNEVVPQSFDQLHLYPRLLSRPLEQIFEISRSNRGNQNYTSIPAFRNFVQPPQLGSHSTKQLPLHQEDDHPYNTEWPQHKLQRLEANGPKETMQEYIERIEREALEKPEEAVRISEDFDFVGEENIRGLETPFGNIPSLETGFYRYLELERPAPATNPVSDYQERTGSAWKESAFEERSHPQPTRWSCNLHNGCVAEDAGEELQMMSFWRPNRFM